MNLSRRGFLKALGISAGGALAGATLPAQAQSAEALEVVSAPSAWTNEPIPIAETVATGAARNYGIWITSEDGRRWVPLTRDEVA